MAMVQQETAAETRYNMAFIWSVALVAAMGGLLFGYDFVVIGGAKPFYEKYFNLLSDGQKGWAMSSALVGCLAGAILSGGLADRFGRKRLLVLAALLFTESAIGTALAKNIDMFNLQRIIGGVGIGLASNLSPVYIAEVSPASMRGRFVSINQLTIVIGILLAQLINYFIADPVPANATADQILNSWNGQVGWRWMFGATGFFAAAFFVLVLLVPETPRWLARRGRDRESLAVLTRIGGPDFARQAADEIQDTLRGETERINWAELFQPRMMRVLLLGVALAVFQQWCGINVIFYYAEEIFKAAGYDISGALTNIVFTGTVNLVFTFVGIALVDRLGRRVLMLLGAAGLAVTYAGLGACYFWKLQGIVPLLLVLAACACFASTLGPVVWVLIAEIFPNRIRGAATAVAVSSLWIGCGTLTYTFPHLNRVLGTYGTFWVYAAICAAGFIYIMMRVPETKGKTLEQIEKELVD